jgi:hypothetical protein
MGYRKIEFKMEEFEDFLKRLAEENITFDVSCDDNIAIVCKNYSKDFVSMTSVMLVGRVFDWLKGEK